VVEHALEQQRDDGGEADRDEGRGECSEELHPEVVVGRAAVADEPAVQQGERLPQPNAAAEREDDTDDPERPFPDDGADAASTASRYSSYRAWSSWVCCAPGPATPG
jgi:hypothetical protein